MVNGIKYLTTKGGITYPYAYTLNVMENIQNQYGSLKEWADYVEPKNGEEANIQAIIWFFTEAINEGIDMENEGKSDSEKRPFVTTKQVGRIITEVGIEEAAKQLKKSVVDSTQDNEVEILDTNSKNVMTTQNQ